MSASSLVASILSGTGRVLNDIVFALWFFLPAGIANVVPIFAAHIPALKQYDAPMDCGLTLRGKRVFGAHKTWRGLIAGVIMATLVLWLQQQVYLHSDWVRSMSAVDYRTLPVGIMGVCFALGALGGDAVESFFKRQRGIKPGHGWFPFDQTDYIIGGALTTAPFVSLSFGHYVWLIILWLGVHVAATILGYHLGLKERSL